MLESFQNVLKPYVGGWNQTQREALVDLLLLGMYTDNFVSLAENDFIDQESDQLKWESGISFSGYLQRSIPKVRAAKGDSQKKADLLQDISDRLNNSESRQKAIEELERLLASDGLVQPEADFVQEAKQVMGA